MQLITLEQARAHCRVDGTADDDILTLYGDAAEEAARQLLNRNIYPDQASLDAAADGTGIVANAAIAAAVLLQLGNLYSNRESVVLGATSQELTLGATSLLWPYRIGLGV